MPTVCESQNLTHWSVLAGWESPTYQPRARSNSTGRKTALAAILGFLVKFPHLAQEFSDSLAVAYRLGGVAPVLEHVLITLRCTGRGPKLL